ncbi:MAG: AAA family ATPase [Phycisphaerae bacterium]
MTTIPENHAEPQTRLPDRIIDAEHQLLACLLSRAPENPERQGERCAYIIGLAEGELSRHVWYGTGHRDIFGATVRLPGQYLMPAAASVADELERAGNPAAAKLALQYGSEYPNDSEAPYWAARLAKLGRDARLYASAAAITGGIDAGQTTDDMADRISDLTAMASDTTSAATTEVSIGDVLTDPEPPQAWVWDGLIPAGLPTILGGHGGAGKSTEAMEIGTHMAMGLPFCGHATTASPVVYYSAEDGPATIRFRTGLMCKAFNIDAALLAENFHVLAPDDPVLYSVDETIRGGKGRTTDAYRHLQSVCRKYKPGLLIVDNASDCFDGPENERRHVRAFIRKLMRLVSEWGGAVLLLVHVNRATAKGGSKSTENYSGSTGWHNSARSRLALLIDEDGPENSLTLRHEKCNFGPLQSPILLTRDIDGVIHQAFADDQGHSDAENQRAILQIMAEFSSRGEYVPSNPHAPRGAYAALSGEKTFPHGLKRGQCEALLRDLERQGHIQHTQHRASNRKTVEIWEVTPKGYTHIGQSAPVKGDNHEP